jgi:ATP synthase protein I
MSDEGFEARVGTRAARKLKAQREGTQSSWSAFGAFGVIGWSVAVPTVLGAWLGVWWDKHHPGARSWTLALLVAGLAIGCANAWYWVTHQTGGDD